MFDPNHPREKWAAPLRALIVAWLRTAGSGTSRDIAANVDFGQGRQLQPDTVSARLNELAALGEIEVCGYRGPGPGRPCKVWRVKNP